MQWRCPWKIYCRRGGCCFDGTLSLNSLIPCRRKYHKKTVNYKLDGVICKIHQFAKTFHYHHAGYSIGGCCCFPYGLGFLKAGCGSGWTILPEMDTLCKAYTQIQHPSRQTTIIIMIRHARGTGDVIFRRTKERLLFSFDISEASCHNGLSAVQEIMYHFLYLHSFIRQL